MMRPDINIYRVDASDGVQDDCVIGRCQALKPQCHKVSGLAVQLFSQWESLAFQRYFLCILEKMGALLCCLILKFWEIQTFSKEKKEHLYSTYT